MNSQKRMFFPPFLNKAEKCERVALMLQKRIIAKTEQWGQGLSKSRKFKEKILLKWF